MIKLTCIGVGNMGGAVARRLATGEFDVTVYDLDESAMERCERAGAKRSASIEKAVETADLIITSLPTTSIVLKSVQQIAAAESNANTVMDISTVDPQTARSAVEICARHGKSFISCALGKTPEHAETGHIPLFVGGEASVVSRYEDVLQRIGDKIYRFGDVEGATTFKLVSNLIGMTNVVALAEGLVVAQKAGIDENLFVEALQDTGAVSFQSDVRLPWMLECDWQARFAVNLAVKDVGLAIDAANENDLDVPVGAAAFKQLKTAADEGFGTEDVVSVAKLYTKRAPL